MSAVLERQSTTYAALRSRRPTSDAKTQTKHTHNTIFWHRGLLQGESLSTWLENGSLAFGCCNRPWPIVKAQTPLVQTGEIPDSLTREGGAGNGTHRPKRGMILLAVV